MRAASTQAPGGSRRRGKIRVKSAKIFISFSVSAVCRSSATTRSKQQTRPASIKAFTSRKVCSSLRKYSCQTGVSTRTGGRGLFFSSGRMGQALSFFCHLPRPAMRFRVSTFLRWIRSWMAAMTACVLFLAGVTLRRSSTNSRGRVTVVLFMQLSIFQMIRNFMMSHSTCQEKNHVLTKYIKYPQPRFFDRSRGP